MPKLIKLLPYESMTVIAIYPKRKARDVSGWISNESDLPGTSRLNGPRRLAG